MKNNQAETKPRTMWTKLQ